MPDLPQYVSEYTDRHGKKRWRYRRRGFSRSINARPGTPEFKAIVAECANWQSPRKRERVPLPEGSVVYFVGNETGSVKIGWTTDLRRRMAQLRTGTPGALQVLAWTPGGEVLERHFHSAFKHARLAREWFRRTPEIDALIAELATHLR